ncbi:MAG: DNA translocase FtsK 4TM domain-containing protein, partial [Alistipes sp.]|nr:DNA translocase FtsK 4TM domain-containing protein [Alistipes sp.]
MAQRVNKTTRSTSKNAKQAAVPASDLRLRSIGLVLIALGVFAVVSVISHFFNWASDLSALNNDPEFSGVKIPFENACKGAGARIADWVVDMSFGVFGLIIPVVLMVIGWRVFRRQLLNLNHFALSAALLLIMGSLTLGVVDCKTDWSYDLGGAIGVACASDLLQAIGAGMILVLFVGWILTGVFINHNFIRTVSNVSDKMVDKSGKILEGVKDFVVARKADDVEEEATDDAPAEIPAMPATPELVAEEPKEQEYVIPRPEPQYEIPPVAPSVPQSEERPMTMNEYLAAKRAAELGEPEDD